MPRRQPPRQLHAMRSPACRAVSSKPNELRRESPSPYLVLLRLPPGRRPVETLVPVQPAATLRRNKASVSLRRPCHSVAAIHAAIVKLERAGITHSKSQSATRRLLHFWLEKCAHLKLESTPQNPFNPLPQLFDPPHFPPDRYIPSGVCPRSAGRQHFEQYKRQDLCDCYAPQNPFNPLPQLFDPPHFPPDRYIPSGVCPRSAGRQHFE